VPHKKKQQILEFPVPKELKQAEHIQIKSIAIDQQDGSCLIKHTTTKDRQADGDDDQYDTIKFQITGDLEADMTTLRNWAKNNFFFIDSPDFLIDELVNCVSAIYTDGGARTIAKIKAKREYEARKTEEEEEGKLKKRYVQKYYSSTEGVLYEAVIIAGKPCFVSIDVDPTTAEPFAKVSEKILLPDAKHATMELLPNEKEGYLSKPYEFKNIEELSQYIHYANNDETLDSLFEKVKDTAKRYIVGSDTHLTILAADTILTYFQDKLGQVHYLYFYGDNDTGKTANLVFMDRVAYRAMFDVDITAANIFTYLGTVQEGQGIILEDEADNVDRNNEKMKLYKRGYNAGGTVTRTDLTFGRKQDSYFVYCFKAFTAERRPDGDKAKGFNERTFYIECQPGTPQNDIVEITNSVAGEPEFKALANELNTLYKLLFAYRLVHFGDPLPDIKNLSVKNREKQLTKPLLRLFQNAECSRNEIGKALADLVVKRRGVKQDTLDAKIYHVIKKLVEEGEGEGDEENGQVYKFTNTLIYTSVCEALEGKYRNEGKDQSFDTPDHGTVSHKRITSICIDKFGASKDFHSGNTRFLTFYKDKLEKAKEAYELAEDLKLLIEEDEGSNRGAALALDTTDRLDRSIEGQEVYSNDQQNEDSQEIANNSINDTQNKEKIEEIDGTEGLGNNENTDLHSRDVSNLSDLSKSKVVYQLAEEELKELTPEKQIDGAIQKAMLDEQGNDKGYFTLDEFILRLAMWPNADWTEDQAEQMFWQLLYEGKLKEVEPDKYSPAANGGA
jgi:hypothetical protein